MCAIGRQPNKSSSNMVGPAVEVANAIPTGGASMSSKKIGDNLSQTAQNLATSASNKQKLTASDNYQG